MSIDAVEFEVMVRKLAADSPEFVYEAGTPMAGRSAIAEGSDCFYVHATEEGPVGGCIIGQALIGVGVPIEEVAKFDSVEWSRDHNGTGAREVLTHFGLSENLAIWSDYVQYSQDKRYPWAEAIRTADEQIEVHLVAPV